jgi:hypothetical protein
MKKNILAENMRRFKTMNLNEHPKNLDLDQNDDRKFTSVKDLKSAIDNLSDDDTDYVLIPSSLEVDGEFDKIYANGPTWKDSVKTEINKTLSQQDPRTVGVKYFYLYQGSPGVYSIEFL